MDNLRFYFEEFEKQLVEIEMYIQSIELQKDMIIELDSEKDEFNNQIDKTLQYSEIIKQVVASPIQYNAVVISIYGCFEQYIDNIFSNYCTRACESVDKYEKLPEKLQEKHIKKLGDFLSNPQRYRNYELTVTQAIENAFVAFNNPKVGIENNQKLVLSHGANLKIDQISELANDLGVNSIEKNIANHYLFKSYHICQGDYNEETYTRLMSQDTKRLFETLDKLVEERNNVAHGWVENRIKLTEIKDKIIGYMKCLAEVISDILLKSAAKLEYEHDKLHCIGKPIQIIDHHIICINNGNVKIHKGDYLVAVKDKNIKVLLIESLERNREKVENITETNVNIGIGFQKREDLNVDKEYNFFCDKSFLSINE
ncbi:MAG: MAE_28990/MAE_18760 family HEPN-like nuclease [Aminipila sp.]